MTNAYKFLTYEDRKRLREQARRFLRKCAGSIDLATDELAESESISRFQAIDFVQEMYEHDRHVAHARVRAQSGEFDALTLSGIAERLVEEGISSFDAANVATTLVEERDSRRRRVTSRSVED